MKALHFDPGHVDGVFDQDTQYAVTTVQKYFGLPRTGVIDTGVDFALTHFRYTAGRAEERARPGRDRPRQAGAHALHELAARNC